MSAEVQARLDAAHAAYLKKVQQSEQQVPTGATRAPPQKHRQKAGKGKGNKAPKAGKGSGGKAQHPTGKKGSNRNAGKGGGEQAQQPTKAGKGSDRKARKGDGKPNTGKGKGNQAPHAAKTGNDGGKTQRGNGKEGVISFSIATSAAPVAQEKKEFSVTNCVNSTTQLQSPK